MDTVIFCNFPLDTKSVDPDYQNEFESVKDKGFKIKLISFEDLVSNDVNESVKKIKVQDSMTKAMYRGWMLTKEQYLSLYDALLVKNIRLINDTDEYLFCHYLPGNYEIIKDHTAKSVWTNSGKSYSIDKIMDTLRIFDGKPVILKDYVKSQKHRWHDACFIENSCDEKKVKSVIDNFIDLQGDCFIGGLVFR
jgi:hypothetical protein